MSPVQTEEIDIRDYTEVIRKMAVRALANMNNQSGYTLDDMIGEGILVFYKDALPHYIHKGQVGHRSNFKSYLTTCLRNHFFGLMKSSFRQGVNDDIFKFDNKTGRMVQIRRDPKAVYTEFRETTTREMSPDELASFNLMVEDIRRELDPRETVYFEMVLLDRPIKDIRKALGVSSITERKIRRGIQKKMGALIHADKRPSNQTRVRDRRRSAAGSVQGASFSTNRVARSTDRTRRASS